MSIVCSSDLDLSQVPAELKQLPRWTLWRYQIRGDAKAKVPIGLRNGQAISVTDRENHHPFEEVIAALEHGDVVADGVGFIFVKEDGLIGIDLDGCIDDEGRLADEARTVLDELGSFAEISPSGRGIKIIARGVKPGRLCNMRSVLGIAGVEMYDDKRFFTITGRRWEEAPLTITRAQAAVDALYRRVFTQSVESTSVLADAEEQIDDDQVLARARGGPRGARFSRLFDEGDTSMHGGDESRADLALCGHLSWWTRDREQIDRLFRRSKLMRPKWDESRGPGRTYGTITIEKAVASAAVRVGPNAHPAPDESDILVQAIDGVNLVVRYIDVQAGAVTATVDMVIDGTLMPASVRLSTNSRRRREASVEIMRQIKRAREDWDASEEDQAALHAAITEVTSLKPAVHFRHRLASIRDQPHTERRRAIDLVRAHVNARLQPTFKLTDRDRAIWCEGLGQLVRYREFCEQADDELLGRLEMVYPWVSAPGGGNARAMTELRAMLRLVWADLVQQLPTEVGAKDLGTDSKAAQEFRRRITDLCMTPQFQARDSQRCNYEYISIAEALVREREGSGTNWRRVLTNVPVFAQHAQTTGGSTEFRVAMSYQVFRIMSSNGRRAAWDEFTFTKLARRYGVGADEQSAIVRGGRAAQRVTVLSNAFVVELLALLSEPS